MGMRNGGICQGERAVSNVLKRLKLIPLAGKGSLNARINIFYMLDTLCDPITSANSLPPPSASQSSSGSQVAELPYAGFLEKDLGTLVGFVVPEGKEGMLNLLSAKQVSRLYGSHVITTTC